MDPGSLDCLIERLEALAERAEGLLPPPPPPPDLGAAVAYRWRVTLAGGRFQTVRHPHRISLSDLRGIDRRKEALGRNAYQFARDWVGCRQLGETG